MISPANTDSRSLAIHRITDTPGCLITTRVQLFPVNRPFVAHSDALILLARNKRCSDGVGFNDAIAPLNMIIKYRSNST
jgi:hypothetical protein